MTILRKALDEIFTHQEKCDFLFIYDYVSGFIVEECLDNRQKNLIKGLKDECQSINGRCYKLCQNFSKLEDELIEIEDKFCGYNGEYEFEDTKVVQLRYFHSDINKIICSILFKYAYDRGKSEAIGNNLETSTQEV